MMLSEAAGSPDFFKVSITAESPKATDAPFSTLLYPAMPAGEVGFVWNDSCAALPNVRKMATTAAALNSGMRRWVSVMVRAFTLTGSSSLIMANSLLSKSAPRCFALLSICW